jgi:hypothetical protein
MAPIKWPKQEHKHCENIGYHISNSDEDQTLNVNRMGVKHQEVEWYGIVSEFNKWSRN